MWGSRASTQASVDDEWLLVEELEHPQGLLASSLSLPGRPPARAGPGSSLAASSLPVLDGRSLRLSLSLEVRSVTASLSLSDSE
jgi:hypothetical protein